MRIEISTHLVSRKDSPYEFVMYHYLQLFMHMEYGPFLFLNMFHVAHNMSASNFKVP